MKVSSLIVFLAVVFFATATTANTSPVCKRTSRIEKLNTQLVKAIENLPMDKWVHRGDHIRFVKTYTRKRCKPYLNRCKITHREMVIAVFQSGQLVINAKTIDLTFDLGQRIKKLYNKRVCMTTHPNETLVKDALKFLKAR
jgi:hypothetical protein